MPRVSPGEKRFVAALLAGERATPDGQGQFVAGVPERAVRLNARAVRALVAAGVLTSDGDGVRVSEMAAGWMARQGGGEEAFRGQHGVLVRDTQGRLIDLAESPLARLALPGPDGTPPFLAAHQVEAGERVRHLADRAQMIQRTTMSYDPARSAARGRRAGAGSVADSALDARRTLAALLERLPADCAGVVFDVCGLLKGLQVIETERGWPRRSAKLVLRIGLDQLAAELGLTAEARGRERGQLAGWMTERPMRFE